MSVHSCGPNCQEPLCVANRRIEKLTEAAETILMGQMAYKDIQRILLAALKREGE